MKNKLLLSVAFCAAIFASCKKENNQPKQSAAASQIEQLVAKYPNLKLVTNTKASQPLNATELKAMDDSLAKFSSLIKEVRVIKSAVSIKPTKSVRDYDLATSEYMWTSYQTIGSTDLGYYNIFYNAVISYESNNSTNYWANYINSVVSQTSTATGGYISGYDTTTVDYAQDDYNSYSTIASDKSSVSLYYYGGATLSHTTGGITVSAYITVNYGGTAYSAAMPIVYPIFN
jgi:hypothetical protein